MPRFTRTDLDRWFEWGILDRAVYLGSVFGFEDGDESGVDFALAERAIKALLYLDALSDATIRVHLNTPGGDWCHGMAVYDAIRSCRSRVVITVWGAAMSMGSVILQAGDERLMTPGSTLMIHDGYADQANWPAKTSERWAEYSKRTRHRMYEIYHSKMIAVCPEATLEDIEDLCSHDTIYTADEAVAVGLADAVVDVAG